MLPLAAVVGLLGWTATAHGQSAKLSLVSEGTRNGQWPSYAGDVRGTKYSPLDQINAANFNDLEVAWRFKTDSLGTRPEYKLEGTPLMVNGVLYIDRGDAPRGRGLDPGTGELLWVHGEHEGARARQRPRQLSGRGLAYWTDGARSGSSTSRPAIACSRSTPRPASRPELRRSGASISSRTTIRTSISSRRDRPAVRPGRGQGRRPHRRRVPRRRHPEDHKNNKGYVRAFDVRTGKRLWIFHTIPKPASSGTTRG
jgi:quinoprotein glucose dehydrogenase